MALRITLRQMEYVVAVGEEGSIAQAAQRLHVSAPSISTAIGQLEAELGVQLFHRRHAQALVLTPAGHRIMAAARDALRQAERVLVLAADLRSSVSGPLSIGCLSSFSALVLPELRARFERKHPEVEVRQLEDDHAGLMEGLQQGSLDLCLTYDLEVPPGIGFEPLAPIPPYIALPPDHPLVNLPVVTPADLADQPMILLDLPGSTAYFLSAFGPKGVVPQIAARTRDMALARSMVANGFGFLLMNVRPLSELAPDGKPLVYRPLSGGPRALRLGMARLQGMRPTRVTEAFEAHCRALVTPTSIPGIRTD
ncbi:LysR family transcriptional regulator [Rubellimicrobium rubrum]|uniref:LysR family transcriptional regulator n=1 Tax=Rubellimicrobium rubrum TaxID=2585369 RepID=A0A5C4MNB3_9RHOB|nr:LysR substrate-binding domain-containing protein [Rubellimicrobium rubrum]TNC47312.1 LysR family transcriptional regulator [Rubellimicrobium rubrum]